jgi:hypothetical protein
MNNTFGFAIEALKQGKKVARSGWNGKGMFLFMRPQDELPVQMLVDNVKSLPQSVKDYLSKKYRGDYKKATDGSPFTVLFTGYICMKASDDTIVNGWLASQTDMLSEDWMIIE